MFLNNAFNLVSVIRARDMTKQTIKMNLMYTDLWHLI